MKMTIKNCDICGKESTYTETKQGVVYCTACAMAHDYEAARKAKNPSLFK